jgi:hypothetical protein
MKTLIAEGDARTRRMLGEALSGARAIHRLTDGVLALCRAEAFIAQIGPGGEGLREVAKAAVAQCRAGRDVEYYVATSHGWLK